MRKHIPHKKTDDAWERTTRSSVHFEALRLQRLISQSFSAFSASSFKNVSAVSGSHSLSEAVLFFSLSFLRLICSEHYCHLLGICSEACCFSAFFTLLHNDIIYYKHKSVILSSLFWIFLMFFFYNIWKFWSQARKFTKTYTPNTVIYWIFDFDRNEMRIYFTFEICSRSAPIE